MRFGWRERTPIRWLSRAASSWRRPRGGKNWWLRRCHNLVVRGNEASGPLRRCLRLRLSRESNCLCHKTDLSCHQVAWPGNAEQSKFRHGAMGARSIIGWSTAEAAVLRPAAGGGTADACEFSRNMCSGKPPARSCSFSLSLTGSGLDRAGAASVQRRDERRVKTPGCSSR